jgi:hypothetical protein
VAPVSPLWRVAGGCRWVEFELVWKVGLSRGEGASAASPKFVGINADAAGR